MNAATTLTATFERSTALELGGANVVGTNVSGATPGRAEVYRFDGHPVRHRPRAEPLRRRDVDGLAPRARPVRATPTASRRRCWPAAASTDPPEGAWNKVAVNIPGIEAGKAYWLGLLNPADGDRHAALARPRRWQRRRRADQGGPEARRSCRRRGRPARPTATARCPAYVFGAPAGPPPPPNLERVADVAVVLGHRGRARTRPPGRSRWPTPAAGRCPSPRATTRAWLTVTPGTGTAPRDLTVAVNTAGLTAGTHTATVRVESAGVDGSPRLIPVTLTLDAGAAAGALGDAREPVVLGDGRRREPGRADAVGRQHGLRHAVVQRVRQRRLAGGDARVRHRARRACRSPSTSPASPPAPTPAR